MQFILYCENVKCLATLSHTIISSTILTHDQVNHVVSSQGQSRENIVGVYIYSYSLLLLYARVASCIHHTGCTCIMMAYVVESVANIYAHMVSYGMVYTCVRMYHI